MGGLEVASGGKYLGPGVVVGDMDQARSLAEDPEEVLLPAFCRRTASLSFDASSSSSWYPSPWMFTKTESEFSFVGTDGACSRRRIFESVSPLISGYAATSAEIEFTAACWQATSVSSSFVRR